VTSASTSRYRPNAASQRAAASPPNIAARLQEAIAAAVTDPELLRGTTSGEMSVAYLSGADWMKSMAARKARDEAI
jgi:hypothetical protein